MPTFVPQKPTPNTVPEGVYKVEIESAENKTAVTSGNPYIKIKCNVFFKNGTSGPTINSNITFTPKSIDRTTAALQALGIAVVFGEPIEIEPEMLIGKSGLAYLHLDKDDDRMAIKYWVESSKEVKQDKHIVAKSNGFVAQPQDETDDIPF